MNQPHTNGILPFISGQDLTDKEGHAISIDNASGTVGIFNGTFGDNQDTFLGVLLEGGAQGEQVSVAVKGALSGTVRVKLASAVPFAGATFQRFALQVDGAGKFLTGSGLTHNFALALEPGTSGDLIEAVILPAPIANPEFI